MESENLIRVWIASEEGLGSMAAMLFQAEQEQLHEASAP
jgi:hypothetical protein